MLIGKAGLSFFVVTLATLSLLRGAVFVYTEGETERVNDDRRRRRSATASSVGISFPSC